MDLSKDEILKKCLHGKTQNPNESFNNIVWSKCQKKTFCSKLIIDMGVNAAIIHYNDGLSAVNQLFEKFGFDGGYVTSKLSLEQTSQVSKNQL